MSKAVFGQPITAEEVERLPPDEGAVGFVRLCGALIGAALAERAGVFTLPEISERVNVPDGGVDATYSAPATLDIAETGGLVGPGKTVYQSKYRDAAAGTRARLLNGIVQRLRKDLRRVTPDCDRYVLLTNLELSDAQRRRLRETLLGQPPLGSKTVVVWGAAEIAQALNAAPRVRHVFFSRGGLCLLDTAEEELRAAYEKLGWPAFVGRGDERRVIDGFAGDPGTRYLEVVGPPYSGRTRLVIESLKTRGASVLWASEPEAATLDLFRELDSHEAPGILVVDGCTPRALRDIHKRAESRQRLKTIAIGAGGRREAWWTEPGKVVVDRLPYSDAAAVARTVLPRVPPLQESWVIEASGRFPGLLLHVGALLRDGTASPAEDPHTVQRRLGNLLLDQYLAGITPEAREALDVASVLSAIGVEGDIGHEVDEVAAALGSSPGVFDRARDELEARGLVRRRGRFVEVVPPRLADELASRILSRSRVAVLDLIRRLPPEALARFLERLANVSGDVAKKTAAAVLGPDGWFPDLPALERGREQFRTLVPAAPEEALRCLERLLGSIPVRGLLTTVTGDFRLSVVSALDDLALGSRTFMGAARLLLAFAAGGTEPFGNSAKQDFISLFHCLNPEVAASLPVRLGLLEEGAGSPLAPQRAVIAKACGAAFSEHWFHLHHAAGAAVPENPGLPQSDDGVRRYGLGVLGILDRLILDSEPKVRNEAIESFLEIARPCIRFSLLPDGLHRLGSEALDGLERAARDAASARQRARVVTCLELIVEGLRSDRADAKPSDVAEALASRVGQLIEALTAATLKDRLWHRVGPKTWRQEVDEEGSEHEAKTILSVATELLTKPELFVEELPWLLSEDAERRSLLFRELGRQDRGERLLDPLLENPDSRFWPEAVGAYFQGWHAADPEATAQALDALVASRPDLAPGLLAATIYLPTSSVTARRILRIAEQGRIPRPELARELGLGLAWERLSAVEVEELIVAIDDGTAETRSALLRAIWLRLARGADLGPKLESLAWSFLETALPVGEQRGRDWGWDALAAKLGEQDSKRLLVLFERLMRESVATKRERFQLTESLPLTCKTLKHRERSGVLQALLDLSLLPSPPAWLDWTLSKMIRPDRDQPALLAFVERTGIEGARLVADVADAGTPGFWTLARELVARWGDDERMTTRLASRALSGGWAGSAVPLISGRMHSAKQLLADPDPKVVRWAEGVLDDLEEWRKAAIREDREEWIWDQRISRAELEGMLERKDSPERLWAIGRLLKDAPESRVKDLLRAEEVLEALPRLSHLDERTRRKWEGWARHWSRAD